MRPVAPAGLARMSLVLLAALAASCDGGAPAAPPPTGEDPPVTPPETPPETPETPGTRPDPQDSVTPGGARPADPGQGMPAWHPVIPLADPTQNDGVGRAPRRLNVSQLRAALLQAVGVIWREERRILTAEAPSGSIVDPNADMLEILAQTLGEPDYDQATQENLDPSATFSKLIGDAARKACRDGVVADLARPTAQRILLRYASERDTAAGAEAAVRRNLQYLTLRFWARDVATDSPDVTALLGLFRTASTAPAQGMTHPAGTPADGWRAVCIALATDPQFLTY